jgi:hypothetical protein
MVRAHARTAAGVIPGIARYRVDSTNDVACGDHGGGPRPGKCEVGHRRKPQFASALLLSGTPGGWQVLGGDDSEEASYVAMTEKMIGVSLKDRGRFSGRAMLPAEAIFAISAAWLALGKSQGISERFQ